MKKLFIGSLLLFSSQAALAQSWTVGPQTVTYPTSGGSYTGIIGDGSDSQGGIAPGYASEAADIPSSDFTLSQWFTDTGTRITPGSEAKFRTHCNGSHEAQEDPILFPGQANVGHLHTFFGNELAGKDSTYTSLRTTGGSTCAGGPANRTAYWYPSVRKPLSTGVTVTIKPDYVIVYYTAGAPASAVRMSRFPRNFAYIGGVDPSDFNDTARRAELPAGFTYLGNGWDGWKCLSPSGAQVNTSTGATYSKVLKKADGSDPWAGACVSGGQLVAVVKAPPCWDGVNIRSPNGRDHLRYKHRHNNSGQPKCPSGWYEFSSFEGSFNFSHTGFSDYGTWYLSSDRMNTPSTAADPTSNSTCRQTGPYFCNGETFHFDWFGAWDYGTAASPGVMIKWMVNCTGVKVTISGTTLAGNPGECGDSTFNVGPQQLLTNGDASPDASLSNDPVISFDKQYDNGTSRFFPLIAGSTGDGHLHHGVPPS